MPFSGSAMAHESLTFLKNPLPSWGGQTSDKRLRKEWRESEDEALALLKKSVKSYATRHGDARLNADPEAKNQVGGQTRRQQKSKALEALKKVAEEGKAQDEVSAEESSVNALLKDGLRDYIDDALDEAERYKRVDRSAIKIDFNWETVGNFNEFPALHVSRAENGPGKPYRGGISANQFEAPVFAMTELGLILESPRDGSWSRFGGTAPVVLDVLPGSAAARSHPRIKRGMRLESINGRSIESLGPEGFQRMKDIRPLRLGVSSKPLDFAAGVGKDCQKLRPDIFGRTMAVDFVRDFCPSEEEKEAARAAKRPHIEHAIPWSQSKGVADLEQRVTGLHQGLRKTGWPPGSQPPASPGGTLRLGSKGLQHTLGTGSGLHSRDLSPGNTPLNRAMTQMTLSASAPDLHIGRASVLDLGLRRV